MELGRQQLLQAHRFTDNGCYLADRQGEEVLLPKSYVPENLTCGDSLEVFVYKDSEDRLVAVTTKPKVQVDEFGYLTVVDVNKFGAFLDWGLPKDLLVPFSEQLQKMRSGRSYLIFVCYDESSDRLIGSAKLKKFLYFDAIDVSLAQQVTVLPYKKNGFGVECIVNNMYQGLIFHSDIHKTIPLGQRIEAYVKNIRDDGKIDIALEPIGYRLSNDKNAALLLDVLARHGGLLELHDKSTPAEINRVLGLSKKAFKRAVGKLYKQKKIQLVKGGIQLLS